MNTARITDCQRARPPRSARKLRHRRHRGRRSGIEKSLCEVTCGECGMCVRVIDSSVFVVWSCGGGGPCGTRGGGGNRGGALALLHSLAHPPPSKHKTGAAPQMSRAVRATSATATAEVQGRSSFSGASLCPSKYPNNRFNTMLETSLSGSLRLLVRRCVV